MRRLALTIALVPALAFAQAGNTGAASKGAAPRTDHEQKRMRVARTVGLAEALDLNEQDAVRVRDVLARYDQQRTPLRNQARDAMRILRDAATGDQAAAGQVDGALQRAREARTKLQQLDAQMLDEITKGMSGDRKARAALFLASFHRRAERMMHHGPGGPGGPGGHGHGPGFGPGGPGPRGPMEGMRPMGPGDRAGPAMSMGFAPDADDLDEPFEADGE